MHSKSWLWTEFLLLFVGVPWGLVEWHKRTELPFFPVLLGMLALILLIGRFDPAVSYRLSPDLPPLHLALRPLAGRFLLVALALPLITWWLYPDLLFRFPRENTGLWLLVLLLYPLLSVAPQEVMFRSFFMPRYRPLFGDATLMVVVNALIFAWAHVFFLNWVAPVLSLVAGGLLADTWRRTRDFRLVCIEHALYGQLVFTSGIGWFFYTGSVRSIEQLTS